MTTAWHVSPWGAKDWAIRKSGATRAYSLFSTRDAAIRQARAYLKAAGGELFVHGQDGQIKVVATYLKR